MMMEWTIVPSSWHQKWREVSGFEKYFEEFGIGLYMKGVDYCNTSSCKKHTPLWLRTTEFSFHSPTVQYGYFWSGCEWWWWWWWQYFSHSHSGNQGNRDAADFITWLPGLPGHGCSADWWRKEEWGKHIHFFTVLLKEAKHITYHFPPM